MRKTVTIVGGGNSAHVLIPFLTQARYQVNLMTRRPHEWQNTVLCELTDAKNSIIKTFEGIINLKSTDPSVVIPEADVIILCMPVHQYRGALDQIGPHINSEKEVSGRLCFCLVHESMRRVNLICTISLIHHYKEVYVGTV